MKSVLAIFAVIAVVFAAASVANAAPLEGSSRPAVSLVDAWERRLAIPANAGKPMLVVYEDKDSATQNAELKKELAALAKGGKYRSAVTLLAVADVAGYDYWPIRGFVKDAIQSESLKIDTPIYCDWDGSVRRTMGLRGGVSNVVLYGRDGKVLFAREGSLGKEARASLLALLQAQLVSP